MTGSNRILSEIGRQGGFAGGFGERVELFLLELPRGRRICSKMVQMKAEDCHMKQRVDEFIPTRESLLSRLRDWDDQESWREFFDTYGRFIYGIARKAGLGDAEAQDVVQETLVAVARQMPGFKYNPALGSFKSWLRQITRRRIVDQIRRRPLEERGSRNGMSADMLDQLADPAGTGFDALWEEEWQRHLLQTALQRVKRLSHPRQFQMFDLYVTQQWPMKSVTETLGVSAAQVYMAKMRVSRMLKAEIRRLQTTRA
jgi:RNA polymerase sigma-70 factor (ECF subfamily)